MRLFTLHNFTVSMRPLWLGLLAMTLFALTACETRAPSTRAATSNTSFEVEPPPNFTRGLLARRTVEPLYPLRAKNLGIEGWVLLRFSVDENGAVINNTIQTIEEQHPDTLNSLPSPPHDGLDLKTPGAKRWKT